ncbi:hypothetical protein CLOM_g21304 [Closterium sp. NIES-68]|nr:hypothetical protein CLOM_g21304 [Closterium sp. NIES-68]GJP82883.1 hypothetical protein CLOP_g13109 [Closterium sp. NIES-67]
MASPLADLPARLRLLIVAPLLKLWRRRGELLAAAKANPTTLLSAGVALGVLLGTFLVGPLLFSPPRLLPSYHFPTTHLIPAIREFAAPEIVDRCIAIAEGGPGSLGRSFSQAHQDWLLFHNYFRHIPYGSGVYVDIGSSHPEHFSNTYFFDRCLGWRGLCVEPNPKYYHQYGQYNRTCTVVPACVLDRNATLRMDFQGGMYGKVNKEDQTVAAAGGEGAADASADDNEIEFNPTAPVPRGYARCRPLEEILDEHAIHTVDFASIDVEGAEASALHCFPFRAYDIRTWLVETDKAGKDLYRIFMRGGYALVTEVLCPQNRLHSALTRMGVKLDSIFRRVSPGPFPPSSGPGKLEITPETAAAAAAAAAASSSKATSPDSPAPPPRPRPPFRQPPPVFPSGDFIYGPAWLPGGEKAGKGPQPACRRKGPCEEQVPHLEEEEVEGSSLKVKLGACRRGGMAMSMDPAAYRE